MSHLVHGTTSFFLFLVETITGLLLMFYYRPTVDTPTSTWWTCAKRPPSASGATPPLGRVLHGDHGLAAHVPCVR